MRVLLYAAVAASMLVSYPAASQEKLYKWVDENGNITYQDQPPPGDTGQVETFVEPAGVADPGSPIPDVDLVLYSIKVCDTCDLLRNLLNERGLPFEEKSAEVDPEVQAELKEVSGVLSVPVLLIGDQVLKGFNRELVLNELEEAGFSIAVKASPQPGTPPSLTREDLEGMTPEQIQEAARDAAARGEDDSLFDEDEGFATLNEDVFNQNDSGVSDDITQWEEIPEDERIRIDDR